MNFLRFFPVDHPESMPANAHVITSAQAREMMARPIDPNDPWKMVKFRSEALQRLMAQPGAHGVADVPVHNGDHNTILKVALDADGNLLLGPKNIALENGERCPPFCLQVQP